MTLNWLTTAENPSSWTDRLDAMIHCWLASRTGTTLMPSSSAIVPSTSRKPGPKACEAMRARIQAYACSDLLPVRTSAITRSPIRSLSLSKGRP